MIPIKNNDPFYKNNVTSTDVSHGVSNSPITSEQRHQMVLHEEIEAMLSSKSYSTEELEFIHKVIKNSNNFIAVIRAIKDCC